MSGLSADASLGGGGGAALAGGELGETFAASVCGAGVREFLAMRTLRPLLLALLIAAAAVGQRRMVLIDQDGSGPGGSNQMAMMALLQSPEVDVLGITMVTGNAWRDEEVQHTLRMLELIGRGDVPVVPGAVFPLVRTEVETRLTCPLHGTPVWLGAWGRRTVDVPPPPGSQEAPRFAPGKIPGPYDVPPLLEGRPTLRALNEDAASFLVRQVRAHPGEVTIYAAGPMTNVALAISFPLS